MWTKKPDEQSPTVTTGYQAAPAASSPAKPAETRTAAPRPSEGSRSGNVAVIGASISVKGEISGNEDLLIEGTVEGTIELKQNTVTVGASGRIRGNLYGRVIHIYGEITGDCFASEQVVVHTEASVNGNITAPRMTLEDGAIFKGSIDTNGQAKDQAPAARKDAKAGKSAESTGAQSSASAVM